MSKVILLELNEVNFEAIQEYVNRGKLPNFRDLLSSYGLSTTTSEKEYEELEPWIQWVTAHTGKTLAEHNVFRLGDIESRDIEQIWEQLERQGIAVGAISPMNAKNRTTGACFFVPDPWTNTAVSGSVLLRKLYKAISQAVNDNSKSRISLASIFWLLLGALAYARPRNYGRYLRLVAKAPKRPWMKAMFLDLLLADVFVGLTRKKSPQFASLFVNAGAHIQHHYMFNSLVYEGPQKNPSWYVPADQDPILDVYSMYDQIVGDLFMQFPDDRFMIATGLHQDPHEELTYYWRLVDHEGFLQKIGVKFAEVHPRMSRDFLIKCDDISAASVAEELLNSVVSDDGIKLFDVDNRGADLFVMLTYPGDIDLEFMYQVGGKAISGFKNDVAFVAIKNGQHNGIGYFVDTGAADRFAAESFPLSDLPERIKEAFA